MQVETIQPTNADPQHIHAHQRIWKNDIDGNASGRQDWKSLELEKYHDRALGVDTA